MTDWGRATALTSQQPGPHEHNPAPGMKVRPMALHEKMLNRCAEVEQHLFDVAAKKRAPPTPAQCRALAMHLGDPTRDDWLKLARV